MITDLVSFPRVPPHPPLDSALLPVLAESVSLGDLMHGTTHINIPIKRRKKQFGFFQVVCRKQRA